MNKTILLLYFVTLLSLSGYGQITEKQNQGAFLAPTRCELYNPFLSTTDYTVSYGAPVTFTAYNHLPDEDYTYTYKFFYGNESLFDEEFTTERELTYTFVDHGEGFSAAGSHRVTVRATLDTCVYNYAFTINVLFKPLCETVIPLPSNNIKLDKFSGQYVLRRSDDCDINITIGCIQGKADLPVLDKVVAVSATTFTDEWNYDYLGSQYTVTGSRHERGVLGKWRPLATYAYNRGAVAVGNNYNSGWFRLSHFNWQNPRVTSSFGWVKASEVTKYSPQGEVVEERNALNIPSAAKFGYHDALPYLVAKNADYNAVFFESFENVYGTGASAKLEDGTPVDESMVVSNDYHSGHHALNLATPFTSRQFFRTRQFEEKGLGVRLWLKNSVALVSLGLDVMISGSSAKSVPFAKVATAGEWSLQEAIIPPHTFPVVGDQGTFQIRISKAGSFPVLIDDVRIQPGDAEMTCYVYDPRTLKVLTVLDDQHFGLFYQYNGEGKLVRKLIETERGVKTVQETQYNLKKKNQSDFISE